MLGTRGRLHFLCGWLHFCHSTTIQHFCFQHEWNVETQELFEDHSDFCASCCHSKDRAFAARICRWFWSWGGPMRFVDHLSCILPESSSGLPLWNKPSTLVWAEWEIMIPAAGPAAQKIRAMAKLISNTCAPWAAAQWGFMAEGSRLRAPGFELAHFLCERSGQAWQLFLPVLFEGLLSMLKSFLAA